jgi:DNA-binding beta-propeller fold protein YncE
MALVLAGVLGLAAGSRPAEAQTLAALCQKDHKVRFFDGRLGKILAEEEAGPAPRVLGLAAEQFRLYVANDPTPKNPDATLRAIGTVGGRFEAEITLPGCRGVSDIEPGPEATLLVACEDSEDVLEVSATDGGLRRRHSVGRGAVGVVFFPDTDQLVVANRRSGELLLYGLEDRQIVRRFSAGKGLRSLQIGFGGTLVGVLDEAAPALLFLEPEGESLSRPTPIGAGPRSLRFVGSSSTVLVTVPGVPGLEIVDLEEEAVQKGLGVGPGAMGLAVDAAGRHAWVGSSEQSTVSVVDLESWAVEHVFPVPGGPTELLLIRE